MAVVSQRGKKVIVRSFDKENEEFEAFVGYNGTGYQIRLGEEVELKDEIIIVLKDAVMVKYETVVDQRGNPTGEMKEKIIPRYLVEKL